MARLLSTLLCEDVLTNPAGRLTLYNIFRDLYAARFPATFARLSVVNSWLWEGREERHVERVVILSPDRRSVVGEATAGFQLGVENRVHTQVSLFRWLLFPAPGTYFVQLFLDAELLVTYPLELVLVENQATR